MLSEVTNAVSLGGYLGRVVLALAVLSATAWLFLKLGRNRGWVPKDNDRLRIIASLSIGRDVFFVLRCGPDVLAVVSGVGGAKLMGRWKYEEWIASYETEELK